MLTPPKTTAVMLCIKYEEPKSTLAELYLDIIIIPDMAESIAE